MYYKATQPGGAVIPSLVYPNLIPPLTYLPPILTNVAPAWVRGVGFPPHRPHPRRRERASASRLVEIRAAQRTFEGAYMRTALSQFSFALVVLKIFTSEFYPIGALFACYGAAVMLVAVYRRYEGNRQFFDCEEEQEQEQEQGQGQDGGGEEGGSGGGGSSSNKPVVVKKKFRTSANSVGFLAGLSLLSYVAMMVLLWQLRG